MALRRVRSNEGKRKAGREAVKQLAPEHREAIEASGYGPGDGYIGLWDQIALLVTDQRGTMTNLTRSHPKAAALAAMKQRLDYLSERIRAAQACGDAVQGRADRGPHHRPEEIPRCPPPAA